MKTPGPGKRGEKMEEEKEKELTDLHIHPPVRVNVKKVVFEKQVRTHDEKGHVRVDIPYTVMEARFASGNRDVYIIIDAWEYVKPGGDQDLHLKKCSPEKIREVFKVDSGDPETSPEARLMAEICDRHHLLDKAGYPKYLQERLEKVLEGHRQHGFFYEPAAPVELNDLQRLDLGAVVWDALDAGFHKADTLLYLMRLLVPEVVPNRKIIRPRDVMPYAPHHIMLTETKPGKTSTAEKVGNVLDRPTVANLLGSSSMNETIHGSLDKATAPTFYDGIEEFTDQDVAKGLLKYLEQGECFIARGHGVKTEGYSPIGFLSNPEGGGLVESLEALFDMLHTNLLGFGSRIPVFIFAPDMPEPQGAGDIEQEARYDAILQAIKFYARPAFTAVMLNPKVREWLGTRNDDIKGYEEKLADMEDELRSFGRISSFLRGQQRVFRHIKGAALRAAFMDLLDVFLEVERGERLPLTLVNQLLRLADDHVRQIININLQSYSNIAHLDQEELGAMMLEARIHRVRNLCKEYEVFTMWILADQVAKEGLAADDAVPLSILRDGYLKIPPDIRLKSRYNSFTKFCEAVEGNSEVVNRHRAWLGFHVESLPGGEFILRIADVKWLKFIAEHALYNLTTNVNLTKMTNDYATHSHEKIGQIGRIDVGHGNVWGLKDKINAIKMIVSRLNDNGQGADEEAVLDALWEAGIKEKDATYLLDKLAERGDIIVIEKPEDGRRAYTIGGET